LKQVTQTQCKWSGQSCGLWEECWPHEVFRSWNSSCEVLNMGTKSWNCSRHVVKLDVQYNEVGSWVQSNPMKLVEPIAKLVCIIMKFNLHLVVNSSYQRSKFTLNDHLELLLIPKWYPSIFVNTIQCHYHTCLLSLHFSYKGIVGLMWLLFLTRHLNSSAIWQDLYLQTNTPKNM
jgi:hypothetical protein